MSAMTAVCLIGGWLAALFAVILAMSAFGAEGLSSWFLFIGALLSTMIVFLATIGYAVCDMAFNARKTAAAAVSTETEVKEQGEEQSKEQVLYAPFIEAAFDLCQGAYLSNDALTKAWVAWVRRMNGDPKAVVHTRLDGIKAQLETREMMERHVVSYTHGVSGLALKSNSTEEAV